MASGGRLNQDNPNQMQGMGKRGGQQYSPMQPTQQPFNVNQAAAGGSTGYARHSNGDARAKHWSIYEPIHSASYAKHVS